MNVTPREAASQFRNNPAPLEAIWLLVGVVSATVRETLERVVEWPLSEDLRDGALEAALYREPGNETGYRRRPEPDWPRLHREMQRKRVTLRILWDEYIAAHPCGYRYSRCCNLYRAWALKLPVTRRTMQALRGSCLFDERIERCPYFVAMLAASSPSYAEGAWTETLPDWISVDVNALESIGGAPGRVVPDNARVAVIKACLYDLSTPTASCNFVKTLP